MLVAHPVPDSENCFVRVQQFISSILIQLSPSIASCYAGDAVDRVIFQFLFVKGHDNAVGEGSLSHYYREMTNTYLTRPKKVIEAGTAFRVLNSA